MISEADIRVGHVFEVDKNVVRIQEIQGITVSAKEKCTYIQMKVQDIKTGIESEMTIRLTEKVPESSLTSQYLQYLYQGGDRYCFMNPESYEQIMLADDIVGGLMAQIHENDMVKVVYYLDTAISIEKVDE